MRYNLTLPLKDAIIGVLALATLVYFLHDGWAQHRKIAQLQTQVQTQQETLDKLENFARRVGGFLNEMQQGR